MHDLSFRRAKAPKTSALIAILHVEGQPDESDRGNGRNQGSLRRETSHFVAAINPVFNYKPFSAYRAQKRACGGRRAAAIATVLGGRASHAQRRKRATQR